MIRIFSAGILIVALFVSCAASIEESEVKDDTLKNSVENFERTSLWSNEIEADILNNFKVMGVQAYPLNGKERVELLHNICNQDSGEKLDFNWDLIRNGGLSTKDIIAPPSFNFSDSKSFVMGDTIGTVSFLQILEPELKV